MTSSGQENAQRTLPMLCANACGFYGSPTTKNLCSKCYREWVGSSVDATATPVNTAVTTNNAGSPALAPLSSSPSSSAVRLGDAGSGSGTGSALSTSGNTGLTTVRALTSSSFPPSMQQIEKYKASNATVVVGLGSTTPGTASGGGGKSLTSAPPAARFGPPLGPATQSGGAALGNGFVAHTSPPSLSVLPSVSVTGTTGGVASGNSRRRGEEGGAPTSGPEELQQDPVSAAVESNLALDAAARAAGNSAVSQQQQQQHCRRSGRSCYLIEPGHHSRPASLSAVTATVAPTMATLETDGASQQLFHPHHHHHHHATHHRSSRMGGGCGSSDLLLPCCSSASPCSVGGGFDGVGEESGGAIGPTGPLAAAGAPSEDCTRTVSRAGSLGALSPLAPLPQQPQVELDAAPIRGQPAAEHEADGLLEDSSSVGTDGVSRRWKASTAPCLLTGLPLPVSGLSSCAPVAEKDNQEEDIVMAVRDAPLEDEHLSATRSGVQVSRSKRVEEEEYKCHSSGSAFGCDNQPKTSVLGSCVSLSTPESQPVTTKELRCGSLEGVLVEEPQTQVAVGRKPSASGAPDEVDAVTQAVVLPAASPHGPLEVPGSERPSSISINPSPEPQHAAPMVTSDRSPLEGKPIQKNKNRCFRCNKKVGLLGFQCRCEYFFCGTHRHADCHDCVFDYKTFGREQLTKANQKVVADKLSNRI